MRSLSILQLLLLLAYCAPQARGLPLQIKDNLIMEIENILNESPVPSQEPLDSNEKFILSNTVFLRINLDEFLNAAKNLQDRGERIRKNLEKFKEAMPAPTSTEDPISIEESNWGDFRRKLNEYLHTLRKFSF